MTFTLLLNILTHYLVLPGTALFTLLYYYFVFLVPSHTLCFLLQKSLLRGLLILLPHQGPLPPPAALCRCTPFVEKARPVLQPWERLHAPLVQKLFIFGCVRTAGCFCETPNWITSFFPFPFLNTWMSSVHFGEKKSVCLSLSLFYRPL